MSPDFLRRMLVFCVLAATHPAQAKWIADQLQAVGDQGTLQLAQTGEAVLAGVILGNAQHWLENRAGQSVLIRQAGQDRYGRTRIIVANDARRTTPSWQEQLLEAGLAVTYDTAAIPKKWIIAETQARLAKRGVWRGHAIRTPGQLGDHLGELVLIEGVVRHHYQSREMWYLNFGEDWKSDASLRIPRRAWRGFGNGFTVTDGMAVRARGVAFLDNGPMLELVRPEQLEIPGTDLRKPVKKAKKKKAGKTKVKKAKAKKQKTVKPRKPRKKKTEVTHANTR